MSDLLACQISVCITKTSPCGLCFFISLNTFLPLAGCYQFPFLAHFFQEEERNAANSKGVKVRPARPAVKQANKQLRTSVGDKVEMFTHWRFELTS